MSVFSGAERSYRRGAIMGLTMAEVLILIAFALLLLLMYWQWDRKKEREKTDEILSEVAAFLELPAERRDELVRALGDGSVTIEEMTSFFTAKEQWRFIDSEQLRRLLDGASNLSNDAKSDLAGVAENENADEILGMLGLIEDLVMSGTTLEELKEQFDSEDTLEGISRKIQGAAARRAELAKNLQENLGDLVASLGGSIDEGGVIVLPDGALFKRGSAEITPLLEGFLNNACRPWLETLRTSDVRFSEVRIEGHASSEWNEWHTVEGAYLKNLDLSQLRSRAVLGKCFEIVDGTDLGKWATKHLIAVGYSSVRPVLAGGSEDRVASRRVVLSVTPDSQSLLDEIEIDVGTVLEAR